MIDPFESPRSSLISLSPQPRQRNPQPNHSGKQPNTNWIQHPSSRLLRQQSSEKRRHRTSTAPQRAHDRKTTYLKTFIQQACIHRRGSRIDRTKEQTHDAHGDCVADNVRDQPDEKLEEGGADDEADDACFLADAMDEVG